MNTTTADITFPEDELKELLTVARRGAYYGLGRDYKDEADDIAHEVVENILVMAPQWKLPAGKKPDNLFGWCFQSAVNRARRRHARRPITISLEGTTGLELAGGERADASLESKEAEENLATLVQLLRTKVLPRLDPVNRRIVEAFHYDGLGFEQIARMNNLETGTAKQRYYRSLHLLQSMLLDELDKWLKGKELYRHALLKPANFAGLFALDKILNPAVRSGFEPTSIPQPDAKPVRTEAELRAYAEIYRLTEQVVSGLKSYDTALAECIEKLGPGYEDQFRIVHKGQVHRAMWSE